MATPYDSGNPYDAAFTFDGDPPASTPAMLPRYTIQATSLAGVTGDVPAAVLKQVAFEFSTKSTLTCTIAEGTPGYDLVNDYSLMKLYRDGVLVDDGQWTVRGVKKSGGELKKTKDITAFHRLWDALERTQVLTEAPAAHKRYFYSLKSVGFILNDLLNDAKVRLVRTIKDLTWTFTGAVDSGGNAWPTVFSIEYRDGTDYGSIFANLVDRGMIEVRLRGNEIQVYIGDKMTSTSPKADLVVGRDLEDAPVQSSSEAVGGVMVVTGDEDVSVVVKNATTIATYGREELSESQGGTSDLGSLTFVADALIGNATRIREQRTYSVIMRNGAPSLPIRDYAVSDYVRCTEMVEGLTIRSDDYRVRQMVLTFENGQVGSASLVVNDKFQEADVRLAKKVEGIIGGAVITGTSRNSTPDDLKDKTFPSPPTNPQAASGVYLDATGTLRAQATIAFDAPTTNTDGTVIDDIGEYILAWRYSDEPTTAWRYIKSDDPLWYLSPLDPQRYVTAIAACIDTSGHGSLYSSNFSFLTAADSTPPPVPSNPVMSSLLRTAIISWNGRGSAGEAMPGDFRHVEVATSVSPGFDFDSGILQGTLTAAGDLIITGYNIGDIVWANLRAVDTSGNKSAAATNQWVLIEGVSGPDISAGAIQTNHLGVGSVDAVAIRAGAVTTDKVTIGQTANLVQDPGFNSANWRGRRLTTEFTEKPGRWFFKQNSVIARNGYLLQMLSQSPAGEEQGKMMMTDWINVQMGEKYYVGCMNRDGEFAPNSEARLHIGIEVEKITGELVTDFLEVNTSNFWFKDGFNLPVQQDYRRIRYWIRPYQLASGDIAVDDFEVRCMVGTTALDGGRIELTAHGLKMWDDLEVQTVNIDSLFGDVDIQGTLRSGKVGQRVEVAPGSTLLPEIRFYPSLDETKFAYINAVDFGSGTIPAIGMNAPDTGATGTAVVLYDVGYQMGEINKLAASLAGPGMQTSGVGASGTVELFGKITSNPGTALGTIYSNKYVVGATFGALVVSKIGIPSSGEYLPFITMWRNTTTLFSYHLNTNTGASYTVQFTPHATLATVVHELVLRMG